MSERLYYVMREHDVYNRREKEGEKLTLDRCSVAGVRERRWVVEEINV